MCTSNVVCLVVTLIDSDTVTLTVTVTLMCLSAETSGMSAVRRQGDGEHVYRGAQVLGQSPHGEP